MGLFGPYRYHEPWEPVDNEIVTQYGLPAYSLFLGDKEITDGDDQVLYLRNGKLFSLHGKTDIYDNRTGSLITHYEGVLFSLSYRYYIQMYDGRELELSCNNDEIVIMPIGWTVRMDGFTRNCTLFDAEGRFLAFIARKAWSLHNRYSKDIYVPEEERLIVTITSVIQSIYNADTSYSGE